MRLYENLEFIVCDMAETEKIQFHRPANNDDFKQSKLEKDVLVFPLLYALSRG